MHPPPPPNKEDRAQTSTRTSALSSKMFSSLPPSPPFGFQSSNYYTPSKPSPLSSSPLGVNRSPLSPRNESSAFSYTMSSPPTQYSRDQCSGQSSVKSSTSKRVAKRNPLIHRDDKDSGRETRRKLFLKRVREDSEDKRWDKKGGDDELLRSIYVADRKRSIGRNLLYDAAYEEIPEDFEANDMQAAREQPSISQPIPSCSEEEMADEVARQEDAELQAYLEMMEAEEAQAQQQSQQQTQWQAQQQNVAHIQKSASDEIDYDKIFEDTNMDRAEATAEGNGVPDDDDMMDMS